MFRVFFAPLFGAKSSKKEEQSSNYTKHFVVSTRQKVAKKEQKGADVFSSKKK